MKKIGFLKIIPIYLIAFFIIAFPLNTFALTKAELKAQQDYYAAQAAAAKQKADQKKKEADQLKQQINTVTDQIDQTQSSLTATEQNVSQTNSNILELSNEIAIQEKNLADVKEKLNQVVASWYMEGDTTLLESVLGSDSISEMTTKQEYYDTIKQQIQGMADNINKAKAELQKQKDDQNVQLNQLNDLQKSQLDQKSYLEDRKGMKDRLLDGTTSAISDLQDEQKIAEQKVAELQQKINQITAASAGSGGDLVSGSAGWYYQQNDPSWSSYKIGRYATIGEVGCLLTSLTMVSNFYGKSYTPLTAAQVSSFSSNGSLISTPIVHDGKSQAIDWGTVNDELDNGHPVVVGLALGVDMGNNYSVSHFVVLKSRLANGKYEMLDPLGSGRGYSKTKVTAMRIISK